MRTILLITMLIVPLSVNAQIVLGYYYGNYEGYSHEKIDYGCLTHIAHAFLIPDSSGELKHEEWFLYPELVEAAHYNNKKIIVSVGGWGGSAGFSNIARDYHARTRFITNLVNFIKEHGYDGADIDWEYPSVDEKINYQVLLSKLRTAFNDSGIEILSVAIPAVDWHDVFSPGIMQYLDWVGLMTYDFYGPWEKTTGHNTALHSTSRQMLSLDYSVQHYLSKGFTPDKLCAGMEYVGYRFNAPGLHKVHKGGKSIPYNRAMQLIDEGWEYTWDDSAKVPYLFNSDSLQFVTFDDTLSIKHKADYIYDNKLAGVIIWKLGFDYHKGNNDLLNITGERLLCTSPIPPQLVYPYNEAMFDEYNEFLEWHPSGGAVRYHLQISDSPDFSGIIKNFYTGQVKFKPVADYAASYKNYWRVRTISHYEQSEWSGTRNFYRLSYKGIVYYYNTDILNFRFAVNENTFYALKRYNMFFESEVLLNGYPDKYYLDVIMPHYGSLPIITELIIGNKIFRQLFFKNYWSENSYVYGRYYEMYFMEDFIK